MDLIRARMAPEDAPARVHVLARRRRVLLALVLGASLLTAGGLVASAFIKSPAQLAADTRPPPRTILSSPVTRQVLTSTLVVRGEVYPARQYDVTPAAAASNITQLYVSGLGVRAGDAVHNGELLAEVSGQPLFALRGKVPAYRDIGPGDTGPDVAELQQALASLGYGEGSDQLGAYGPGTGAAVAAFYQHLGYQAPTAGGSAAQTARSAGQAVRRDQSAIAALRAKPQTAAVKAALASAERRLSTDTAALRAAKAAQGPMVPAGEVVFLPSFPAEVVAVNGSVGTPVSGPLLELTTGRLQLTAEVPPAEAALVKPGMKAQIYSETLNASGRGRVAGVGAPTTAAPTGQVIDIGGAAGGGAGSAGAAGTGSGQGAAPGPAGTGGEGGSAEFVPVAITASPSLNSSFNGLNVRVTIDTGSSGRPVLTVPVAAIFTTASGQTWITVVGPGGRETNVPVAPGLSAGGYTEVTPAAGARLRAGDMVAVGR